jgi:hypothetical protein
VGGVTIDLAAAAAFMATHARLLDRRRFRMLDVGREPAAALAALDAYRNDDGGYGWGLEPDLRSGESQPGAALHALEVFEEAGPVTTPRATQLCDWLASASLPDGGLPFARPVAEPAGCAPFWVDADSSASSLHITSAVAGAAHRVARHDPAVAGHPWLGQATDYCLTAIERMSQSPHALEVLYVLQLLDALADDRPEAAELMARVGAAIPPGGSLHVAGGLDDELLRPLDFAPAPARPVRALFPDEVVTADLDRVARLQRDDGGWPVEWATSSPAAALEWRGYLTVRALSALRRNGRLALA